jgi:SAM-dependent methyltransferase
MLQSVRMLPQTAAGETSHRRHKRELEITATIDALQEYFSRNSSQETLRVLEFGAGDGFQIPYLKKLGSVAAIDVKLRESIKRLADVDAYECSITKTAFPDKEFDLIFSNHVLEHIESLDNAFQEMKRIGKEHCLYAFSVPTNIWLLLSIPAQYYNKFKGLRKRFGKESSSSNVTLEDSSHDRSFNTNQKKDSILSRLGLCGHGVRVDFGDCYDHFRISCWQELLIQSGFRLLKVQPLLLYGPSEWPVIPTMKPKPFNVCSSVLLLSTKA